MTDVFVHQLSKFYGPVRAVDAVSFAVSTGEFVTLLGPSGCGKTTTLRAIAGFVLPSSGQILVGDKDVTSVSPNRRDMGLVFQNYALFPHMTVAENIDFGLKMRRVERNERQRRVDEALRLVKLDPYASRYPRQLSGGQQQRVALARALVIDPCLLLLDEPFGALDKQLRDHMREELVLLQKRAGIGTIFVTHDQQEALSMSDRVAVMNGGRIEQIGTPKEIYERPRTRFVAEFLGRSNILRATVVGRAGTMLTLAAGALPLGFIEANDWPSGSEINVLIRPEAVSLRKPCDRTRADAAGITGTIVNATYFGLNVQSVVELADGTRIEVISTPHESRDLGLAPGQRVEIEIRPDGLWPLADEASAGIAKGHEMSEDRGILAH